MPHQLDKSKILPAVTTAIYMTGSNQKNASTYGKGLWEVARHTSIFTPTQHGLSVLWPFQVLWLRTKCCGNSVTGKQGVACMCNELPLAEFILKQNQKKKKTLAMLLYFDELVFPCWDWWVRPCQTDRWTPHPTPCIFPSFSFVMLEKQLWLQSVCNYRQKPTTVVPQILD